MSTPGQTRDRLDIPDACRCDRGSEHMGHYEFPHDASCASCLMEQLGWGWDWFERAARNSESAVLCKVLGILESPATGDERLDRRLAAAKRWVDGELARRNGQARIAARKGEP